MVRIHVLGLGVGEGRRLSLPALKDSAIGIYGAQHWTPDLGNAQNQKFVAAYKAKYGEERVTADPIEAGYIGVHLWAKAVSMASSFTTARKWPRRLRCRG